MSIIPVDRDVKTVSDEQTEENSFEETITRGSQLPQADRHAVIAFLETLVAPPTVRQGAL